MIGDRGEIIQMRLRSLIRREKGGAIMEKNWKRWLARSGVLFGVFAMFTVLVACVDRQPIGPAGSVVGLAAINGAIFELLGVSPFWYDLTEWMGFVAVAVVLCFGVVGACQLVTRRSLSKVDSSILVLGGFYGLVLGFYLLFEVWVINCRPILTEGVLEASYPSSHTMLVLCVMITAAMQLRILLPKKQKLCRWIDVAAGGIAAITVVGRLLSGVHWFADIVGGVLLSGALIALYRSAVLYMEDRRDA